MQSITPPLIAVIGDDGSGKLTVREHLITAVGKYGAAERVYLGKQARNVSRAVAKSPLMGESLHKTIRRDQVKAAKKLFGPIPALVITAFAACRLLRSRHMPVCRCRGLIVPAGHYLWNQIPGTYDGTVFLPNVEGDCFISQLTSQERKAFHWMAGHKSDLVIKLDVDLEAACARKPDHKRESSARETTIMP